MNSIVDPSAFASAPSRGSEALAMPVGARPAVRTRHEPGPAPGSCANVWLRQLFDAKSARTGGVVRRRLRDVEDIVGLDSFHDEVARRGYTAITDGHQVVVFCHAGGVRRIA